MAKKPPPFMTKTPKAGKMAMPSAPFPPAKGAAKPNPFAKKKK